MTEHVTHLETLRDEITIMTERKLDLERRIEVLKSSTGRTKTHFNHLVNFAGALCRKGRFIIHPR